MSVDTLYVLGDQSLDLLPSIQRLTRKCRQHPALKEFMRTATDVIQNAISTVPAHIRPCTSHIDSLLQLAENIKDKAINTPVVSSLLVATQLGEFIVHLSTNPCALDGSQGVPAILGLCTGSISAAAIASSRNVTELLQVAPLVVSLSFYVGLEAFKRSHGLESSDESWATIVRDTKPDELQASLDYFNQQLDDRCHRRVYISAIGESSVTISGPPSIVRKFLNKTPSLNDAKPLRLPIRAAFHGRHLVPIPHERIFGKAEPRCFKRRLQHLMISPCTGRPYMSLRLDCVLHEIVDEILQQPIQWRMAMTELSSTLPLTSTVITVGPFVATNALAKWFPCPQSLEGVSQDDTREDKVIRGGSGAVAIVGMSIRAPGSETLDEFWDVLQNGKDLHQKIPIDRFDTEEFYDPSGKAKNATSTPYGVFIDRPGYFDPRFFNMSPREAYQTDPQQRLMLLTTYEALENAGYSPNRTASSNPRRIASFIGQTGDDYRDFNASQNIDTYFITGNIRAFGPGRLNYHFGWEGPSFSVDTACSSSAASIQLACSALLSRECDTAVSGGANLLTSPDLFAGLSRGGFLSKTGGCKTFDQDADGYVRGEACGVVVLKRLEDAVADRDNVLAVIRGAATNHSAEAISITHPHQETQERLFKAVIDDAGISAHEVDLAEIHGTGTQAGDATESRSVTNVLCQGRKPENPLVLSTVKPNIGHGEAASGVSSIIKAVLMMRENTIPPHVGIKNSINEKLPRFDDLHTNVCYTQSPFLPRMNGDGKRRILVNNFDAAGGNTSMLLEDPPQLTLTGRDRRGHQVVAFSAKSATALSNNIASMRSWLKRQPTARIEDLAYTTTSRRMHHSFRRAYVAGSVEELAVALERSDLAQPIRRASNQPTVVFCFTGQGSQYVTMASDLYETHPTFRDYIDDCANICDSYHFPSFLSILKGDREALECPVRTQLSLVAIELALAFLWNSWGVRASAVVGHSLGEYAACCHAGIISLNDCLYLVGKRAELITGKCRPGTHAMLAIQASFQTVKQLLKALSITESEIACFNGPTSTVLSGPSTEINHLNVLFKSKGYGTKVLPMKYAFHSSQLDSVLNELEVLTQGVNYMQPDIPVASTLLGEVVLENGIIGPGYFKLQTRKPVVFQDAIEALHSQSIVDDRTVWVEIGPHPTCVGMIKAIKSQTQTTLPTLQKGQSDWRAISSSVTSAYNLGVNIDWSEFHRPFEHSLQLLQLPNYAFDLKNYWIYREHNKVPKKPQHASRQEVATSDHSCIFSPTESLQRLESNESTQDMINLVFAADTSSPALNKALRGHQVNGIALCSSSVYAEMAFAAASFVRKISGLDSNASIEINDLEVVKPLIVSTGSTKQVIYVSATKQRLSSDIQLQFSSQEGETRQDHATCVVHLCGSGQSSLNLTKDGTMIKTKIDQLQEASSNGKAHRLLRPMVYKLFRSFVDYSPEYQGLDEVFLNTEMLEAAANVKFQSNGDGFTCNPYWIDSIAHLSGFILNGSEFTPSDSVFISHGWKSLKLNEPLFPSHKYQSYVRMQSGHRPNILTGDVYLFHGERIVAICQGLNFQQIKRSVLDFILPKPGSVVLVNKSNTYQPPPLHTAVASISAATAETEQDRLQDLTNTQVDVEKVLDTIASELGLKMADLDEEAEFSALGVDSLMTTSILAMLGAQLNLYLPASIFIECNSIKGLRTHFCSNSNPATTSVALGSERSAFTKHGSSMVQIGGNETSIDFSMILDTIAQELGVDIVELDDDTAFADLGVDSLITMSMLLRLNEIVNDQLPASLFAQYPTVAGLRSHFQAFWQSRHAEISELSDGDSDDQSVSDDESLGHVTPATELDVYNDGVACLANRSITAEIIRSIVAEEIGISTTEVEDDTSLVELGVDSLLSLSILAKVRDQTGMILASTFLVEHPTFSAIERTLLDTPMRQHAALKVTGTSSLPSSLTPSPPQCEAVGAHDATEKIGVSTWSASSILLQGTPLRREPCLFLIPDGSGSSGSYIGLPDLKFEGPVYGLNSPFLDDPAAFKMSLQDLVTLYVTEMIRIQPRGPYHIGGWSVGGICAFEAASQLIRKHGQEVSSLILIDAPCPTSLPPLPLEEVDFLQAIGALDTSRASCKHDRDTPAKTAALGLRTGVREHFAGSINALEQYSVAAIDGARTPKSVTIIWAHNGVWETLGNEMKVFRPASQNSRHPTTCWLMDSRPSYGTCGWEALLPGSNFTCHTVPGDHFSMMKKPGITALGAKISSSFTRR